MISIYNKYIIYEIVYNKEIIIYEGICIHNMDIQVYLIGSVSLENPD